MSDLLVYTYHDRAILLMALRNLWCYFPRPDWSGSGVIVRSPERLILFVRPWPDISETDLEILRLIFWRGSRAKASLLALMYALARSPEGYLGCGIFQMKLDPPRHLRRIPDLLG